MPSPRSFRDLRPVTKEPTARLTTAAGRKGREKGREENNGARKARDKFLQREQAREKHGGGKKLSREKKSNPTPPSTSFSSSSHPLLLLRFLFLHHHHREQRQQEGCVCQTRWVPPGPRAGAATNTNNGGGASSFRLAVPCPADLSWHDIVCCVKDVQTMQQKQVLHPCSGIAVPGETVALMGPSGAGKSTLLDVLAGRKTAGKLGGGVKMNGRPCGTLFKRISAYVAQEDVFVPTMTAWETLVFHATLTLPKVSS